MAAAQRLSNCRRTIIIQKKIKFKIFKKIPSVRNLVPNFIGVQHDYKICLPTGRLNSYGVHSVDYYFFLPIYCSYGAVKYRYKTEHQILYNRKKFTLFFEFLNF
jgi:hypothetical protein